MHDGIIEPPADLAAPERTIHLNWPVVNPARGEAIEVDVIVTTPDRWERRPESKLRAWGAARRGDLVVAIRVVF